MKRSDLNAGLIGWCLIFTALIGVAPDVRAVVAPGGSTVTIVDDTGREVVLPCPAKRLVTLGSAGAEIVWALGAGARIVGRSRWAVFPPAMNERPSVGSVTSPNLELLWELKPDVVIADTHFLASAPRIESLGIPVVFINGYRLDRIGSAIERIGRLLGERERAERFSGFIQRHLELLSSRIAGIPVTERPKVFRSFGYQIYVTASDKGGGLPVLELAGGRNIAAHLPVPFPQVDSEWIVMEEPDYLILDADLQKTGFQVADASYMASLWEAFTQRPGIRKLACVQKGQGWVMNVRIAYGPRGIIEALYLAKRFHPGHFSEVDPEAVHQQMLKEFYGIDLHGTYIYP